LISSKVIPRSECFGAGKIDEKAEFTPSMIPSANIIKGNRFDPDELIFMRNIRWY